MEVILKKQEIENPTFGEVKTSQQFICRAGYLCLKISRDKYVILSNSRGTPMTSIITKVSDENAINLILPEIERYVLPKT